MTNIALGAVDIKDKELNGFYLKNTLLDRNYFLLNATAIFGSTKKRKPKGQKTISSPSVSEFWLLSASPT
jgi:hypothetical protein